MVETARFLLMTSKRLPGDEHIRALFERLALAASKEITAIRSCGFDVHNKADSTPVTEADTRAEAVILDGLEAELPGIPHIGEEEMSAGRVSNDPGDCFILVDPLDGTREFICGRDEFTVNIALIRDGSPEIGVVVAPAMDVAFSALPGCAERLEILDDHTFGARTAISVSEAPEKIRIVASRSHQTPETAEYISRYADAEILSVGSSLKFCMLAEGKADLYPRFGRTMEWDTAAGDAILRAAGGQTQLLDGSPLTYGKRNQLDDCDFSNPWFVSKGR